mgnify:FL=1
MITWNLAKQACKQNTLAYYAACLQKAHFTPYVAANYGSEQAKMFGIGQEPK